MSKDFTNEEIILIVNEIRGKIINNLNINKNDYSDFIEKYENLYNMVIQKDFDDNCFKQMLALRSEMMNGKKTLKQSSEEISTKFFKKFHPDLK